MSRELPGPREFTWHLLAAFEHFINGDRSRPASEIYNNEGLTEFIRQMEDAEMNTVLNYPYLGDWKETKNEAAIMKFFVKALNKCVKDRMEPLQAYQVRLKNPDKATSISDADRKEVRDYTVQLIHAFGEWARGVGGPQATVSGFKGGLESYLNLFGNEKWDRIMAQGPGEWKKQGNEPANTEFFMQSLEGCLNELRRAGA